jgi:transcriptional regulator with XRE-family HTH domain
MAFVTKIKEYRAKLNMTQVDLAKQVGVRRETISHLEKDTPDKKSPASSPPLRDGYEKGKINTGTHRLYKPYIFLQFPSPSSFHI